jgi:hypothetical protein
MKHEKRRSKIEERAGKGCNKRLEETKVAITVGDVVRKDLVMEHHEFSEADRERPVPSTCKPLE